MVDRYENIRQEKLDEADNAFERRTFVSDEVKEFLACLKAENQFLEKGVSVLDAYGHGPHIRFAGKGGVVYYAPVSVLHGSHSVEERGPLLPDIVTPIRYDPPHISIGRRDCGPAEKALDELMRQVFENLEKGKEPDQRMLFTLDSDELKYARTWIEKADPPRFFDPVKVGLAVLFLASLAAWPLLRDAFW